MNSPAPCALDSRGLAAAVLLGTIGALTIMIVPGFVMLIGAQSGLDDRHLGFVASWDINAMAVAIGLSTFLIARFNWRQLAIVGALLIAVGSLRTGMIHGYEAIIVARVCAGAGEGLAVAVSFAALGSAANPDRAFGVYLVVGLTVGAGVLALLPWLQAAVGSEIVFFGVGVLTLVSIPVLFWLPPCNPAAASWGNGCPPVSKELALSGLVGVFLYFIAQGAMWSYFERIGRASGVDPNVIGKAMGLSSFAGMGGALLAISICSRGRVLPLIVSGAISAVSFWMLRGHVTASELLVAGLLFNFAWNLAQPLLSGVCAQADVQGRVVVAMGCIQTVGFGVGPALAAMLLRERDFSRVTWMSLGVLVASLAIVFIGLGAQRRHIRPPAYVPLI